MSIRGGPVKSVKDLRRSLRKGSGGFLKRIPAEGIMVRFMTEPNGFYEFIEHYDSELKRYFPCADECPACEEGIRATTRYLANVVDTTESRVEALVLPKSLVDKLVRKYDKYGTLMDRTYELSKSGQGQFDTEYDVDNEGRSTFNMKRYEPFDLDAKLTEALPGADDSDDEDDEDDDGPMPPPAKKAVAPRKRSLRSNNAMSTASKKLPPKKRLARKTLPRK